MTQDSNCACAPPPERVQAPPCRPDSSAIRSSCQWEGTIQPTFIFSETLSSPRTCGPHHRVPALCRGSCTVSGHRCHTGGRATSPLLQASGPGPEHALSGHSQPTGNLRQELERPGEIVGSLRLKSGSRGRGGPLTVICFDKRGFCHSVSDTPGETKALQIGRCPLPKKEGAPGRLDAFASR